MKIEVILTPAELPALARRDLRDAVCVVFDVLRATSTFVTALHNGAKAVIPVSEIAEALAIRQKQPDVLLGGERNSMRIRAGQAGGIDFDFGNSPREYKRKWGYEQERRVPIPVLPIERRIGVSQIELGYNEEEAQREASRCLHCWENTVFNEGGEETGSECILCGGCVDICPENCIELAVLDRLEGEVGQMSEVGAAYDVVIAGQSEERVGSKGQSASAQGSAGYYPIAGRY